MISTARIAWLLMPVLAINLCQCSSDSSEPTDPAPPSGTYLSAPGNERDWLSVADLQGGTQNLNSPLHNGYFLPVGNHGPALHPFSGTLILNTTSAWERVGNQSTRFTFPAVSLGFASDGDDLIPTRRTIIKPNNTSPFFIIVDPGKLWSESSDGDWSRAAFPFVLVAPWDNQAHNGVATFVYNESSVSDLRIQVVQETASWYPFDGWGQLQMDVTPLNPPEGLIESYRRERHSRVPVGEWGQLDPNGSLAAAIHSGIPSEDISSSGMILNDTLFLGPSQTRFGPYPFPHQMRHGAFSVTKSAAMALALARLALDLGPDVLEKPIEELLTVTASHSGWAGVTLADALNMATGIGDRSPNSRTDIFADENQPKMSNWATAPTLAEKLDVAFDYGDLPWGPGEVFRYNSTHTFVLAAAMDALIKSEFGDDANLMSYLNEYVYQPIGIQHVPMMLTYELNPDDGVPWGAVGLYPTADDIAKIAILLQNEGRYGDDQILHPEVIRRALFRSESMGLRSYWSDNADGNSRYQLSFWTYPIQGDSCFQQVPYMSGYGGNVVALLPNGLTAFRFADAQIYSPRNLIEASLQILPLCP